MNERRVVVRAPGRLNLIGEHTDYSLLPVLPVAIDRGLTIIAQATEDGVVEATSEAFAKPARLPREQPGRPSEPWQGYLGGALRELVDIAPGMGARVAIGGNLPATGGLSSSSALTVGLVAALSAAWGANLERAEIARRAIVAERHVGVESGGMDQTAIVFGRAGHALRIDFNPPGIRAIAIPGGLRFVVASSGEEAPKGGAAREAYNERVVGARLGAALLADQVGVDLGSPPTLSDVAGIDVVDILVGELPQRESAQGVAHGAGVGAETLVRLTATTFDPMEKVPVRRIARHILSEAGRVAEAEAALGAGEMEAFGVLLDESHNSLRQDMRCSTAALDQLCSAMRRAGAYGARLTGAGFGGFALAAVAPERLEAVIEAAMRATGGPAFEVRAVDGLSIE